MARKTNQVVAMNLGLYNDRPCAVIPDRGLQGALNIRIRGAKILRENIGWGPFFDLNLTNPVTMIESFRLTTGAQILVFGTTTDLFEFDEGTELVSYITPIYATGTVSISGTDQLVGVGTSWLANVKAGDMIYIGSATQRDPTATWVEVESVDSDTLIILTTTVTGPHFGAAYTARKLFTGGITDPWDSATFLRDTVSGDDLLIATNGVDYGISWNGSDNQVTSIFVTEDVKFETVSVFKNMAVYGNITVAGTRKGAGIRTSDIGKPLDITNGFASELLVHNGSDWLLSMVPLADALVLYSENRITLAQFVEPPILFVFRDAISENGPLSKGSIVDFGDHHEFISQRSAYKFDGANIRESGGHVWREVLKGHSPNRKGLLHSHIDEENGEAMWFIPLTTDPGDESTAPPQIALVQHFLEDTGSAPKPITKRELPATAIGVFDRKVSVRWSDLTDTWAQQSRRWNDGFFQASFPFNLFGDESGNIFILGDLDSKNGAAITSKFRTKRFVLGDGKIKMLVKRIYPFTEKLPGSGSLTIRVYTANFFDGEATLKSTLTFDMTHVDEDFFVSPRVVGRFAEFEFEVVGTGNPFSFSGLDYDVGIFGAR